MEKQDIGFEAFTASLKEADWSPRLQWIRATVESIGADLKPDGDWMPVVLIECEPFPGCPLPPGMGPECYGQQSLVIVALGELFDSDEGKDRAAESMKMAAVMLNAHAMTFISVGWMVMVKGSAGPEGETEQEARDRYEREIREYQKIHGQPKDDPDHIEKLMLISVAYGGEDDGTKQGYADIVRTPDKPPQLANWKLVDDGSGGSQGRFPEAIYEGLKAAWEIRCAKAQEGK
jgi:hypothetical protein